jgi:hypothetical protein
MGIAKGVPWGEPEDGRPDLTIAGNDTDLALAVRDTPPGVLVAYVPSAASDLARAVGLRPGAPPQGLALPMDVLELEDGRLAVSSVVLGPPPDRLTAREPAMPVVLVLDGREQTVEGVTTVVVATGQWLRGLDLVPRGHPGDGRAEVQAYRLGRIERRRMRARLPTGTHLPHPRIVTALATAIEVRAPRSLELELDGRTVTRAATLRVRLVPARYRLLV